MYIYMYTYANSITTDDHFFYLLLRVSRVGDHQTGLQLVSKNKLTYKSFTPQMPGL